MPHRRIVGYGTHIPRNQARTTGKQEGTLPKKLKGKRKKMNANDEMLKWQNILDTGTIVDVRETAHKILAKMRRMVEQAPAEPETPDLTASHYLEVCATVDRLRETVDKAEGLKRKTIPTPLIREIVGTGM